MKCLITGGSGFVGRALCERLGAAGHRVIVMGRKPDASSRFEQGIWDYERRVFDCGALAEGGGLDAAIHLAGENVAGGRWTEARKRRIRESRIEGTRFLLQSLRADGAVPKVFLAASAVGVYGDRGGDVLTEESGAGEGFLAELAVEWEAAANELEEDGARVGLLRFGMVLDAAGGALGRMLPIFRMGLGGPLGGGGQWMSWTTRSDAVRAIEFALSHPTLAGPIHLTAPNPVTNREFSTSLGKALGRPALLPAPAFALRLMFGEMADALLIQSQRAIPAKLLEAGFKFEHPDLKTALASTLAKPLAAAG